MCFLVFGLLTILFYIPKTLANGPLNNKIIIIDVGHGGVDPGTVVGKIYEKDINLKISLSLKEKLEKNGAQVIMTRDGDYDLGTPKATYRKKSDFDHRIMVINNNNADYYISIHLNYLENKKYYGPQVFYNEVKEENKELAIKMQELLNEKLKTTREVKKIPSSTYMYSKLNVKGVLVECGFLSNDLEREKLLDDNYINLLTDTLANAFLQFSS